MTSIKDVKIFNNLIEIFPEKIKNPLFFLPDSVKSEALEIRVNNKVRVVCNNKTTYFNINIDTKDLDEIFKSICRYSAYSFQDQMQKGFITFKGGHRIGIASSAVIKNGEIVGIKNITSFNFRIAREFKGCSDNLYKILKDYNLGVLIVGTPSSGKTTLLRDLARNISKTKNVTIIDERFEIAASYEGKIEMDIGQSDVLSGFSKTEGILRAIRCLSPKTVICDEIGNLNEAKTINEVLNSGVQIIASVHAKDEKELIKKPQVMSLLKSGAFGKIVLLKPYIPGKILKIFNMEELLNA